MTVSQRGGHFFCELKTCFFKTDIYFSELLYGNHNFYHLCIPQRPVMKLSWLLTLFIFCCCKNEKRAHQKPVIAASKTIIIAERKKPTYEEMKARIQLKKHALGKQFTSSFNKAGIAYLQTAFVSVLVDSILPYWYGTPWDFNGTTQTPGEGSIACGYFITTVLQHAGVRINRVRLAQCASQQMIEEIIVNNQKRIFSNASMEKFTGHIKQQGFGLYIVGLDAHVGFLYNDGQEIYFIHAKWANPKPWSKKLPPNLPCSIILPLRWWAK